MNQNYTTQLIARQLVAFINQLRYYFLFLKQRYYMNETEFKKMFEKHAEPIVREIMTPIAEEYKKLLKQCTLRINQLNDATNNVYEQIENMDKLYKKQTKKINLFVKKITIRSQNIDEIVATQRNDNDSLQKDTLIAVENKLDEIDAGYSLIQKENKNIKEDLNSLVINHKAMIANQITNAKADVNHLLFNAKQELEQISRRLQMTDLKGFTLFCDAAGRRINDVENEMKLFRAAMAEVLK
jgi:hypothetical protein